MTARTYTPLAVTPEQRANLEMLHDRSPATERGLPMNMGYFSAQGLEPAKVHPCGTAACMAGRGPLCGVPALPGEWWFDYIKRAFGIDGTTFSWLFSSGWTRTDNTLAGARARLRIALDRGVPSDARGQMRGDVPLEYAPEDPR